MRILLVDDDRNCLELMSGYLRVRGHDVYTASNAREALALADNIYDALIVDIELPDLDGYSLAREIRRIHAFRVKPCFVALSRALFDPDHPHAAEAAFDIFLNKPTEMSILTASLYGA